MHQLMKLYSLVYVKRKGEVLLGWKKKGFGVGMWNGFGGKIEPGETAIEAAVRELREESELETIEQNLKNIGHLEFTIEEIPKHMEVIPKHMEVHLYTTTEFKGTPVETDEMRPKWFRIEELPFKDMWPDDPYWFPYMIEDKPFVGKFHYRGLTDIINYDLRKVDSMEKFYNE